MFEVGDHPDDMGQRRKRSEGRASFEIDEEEVEMVGPMTEDETGEQGREEFGLPRARGTGEEPVRSVVAQPEDERFSSVSQPDWGFETSRPSPRPQIGQVELIHAVAGDKLAQPSGPG